MQFVWNKPVITFYKERFDKKETEPFAVLKCRELVVTEDDKKTGFSCVLKEFFPLMGSIDYVSTKEGKADSYVLCWSDDNEDDFSEGFRRLTGVTFKEGIRCETTKKGKLECYANFKAKHGKLK